MRWLITGGCGFIGRNLIRRLLGESGHGVRVVDDLSVGTRADLGEISPVQDVDVGALAPVVPGAPVQLLVGDVLDAELAQRAVTGVDAVVHLAANTGVGPSVANPRRDCSINVLGTLNYLEACRHAGCKRFVFASSGAPVGECNPPIHEELPPHPESPYGASKLAGEGYCSAYKRSFGIDTTVLRFGNCYGPLSSHKGSVVAKFIRDALQQRTWEIYGDGHQTRDFIYVDDIVDAILRAATVAGIGGQIFQIATNAETSVLELSDRLRSILRERGVAVPAVRHGATRTGDVRRNFSDTSKARARLEWQARVPLDEGLRRTVDWFLADRARLGV
ncbi:MAG: NAD-dependent epimerase/dehydratase family protein [Gemmatimonas sp.]